MPALTHFRSDSFVRTMINVPIVIRRPEKNSGLMPVMLTPPYRVTSQVANSGPAIPRKPAATVSQISMPVARSRLTRQFPQMVAQL